MRIGSLFSGYGGLDQAVAEYTGATTAWVSEIDKGACKVLANRYPDAPNIGDITAVDWTQVERVDILTGGFPCQDVSHAGKRAGVRPGTRSGLWTQMCYAIEQLQPKLVVIENVRGLLSASAHSDLEPCPWCVGDGPDTSLRALGAVLGGLADIGYDARWCGLRAADVGAPHGRFRIFVVAYPHSRGRDKTFEHDGGRTQGTDGASVPDERHRFDGGSGPDRRVTLLPTPSITAMRTTLDSSQHHQVATRNSPGLDSLGALLRTPMARDGKDVGDLSDYNDMPTLPRQVQAVSGGVHEPLTGWGEYQEAVTRWEGVLGRPCPPPTLAAGPGRQMMLSPVFVEWMMGLPEGWVTGVPGITRNEGLKALGNGVVPLQALEALRRLLR